MSKSNIKLFVVFLLMVRTLIIFGQTVPYELKTVVIDPGHGGKSPGTVVEGIMEKDIVIKVALKAGEIIKKTHPGVNLIYTRTRDVGVDLSERAEIANRNKADLFISIHANYFKNSAVSGSETYVLGLHRTQENLELAKLENSVILLEDDYETRYEGFNPNEAESYIMFELLQDEFLEQSRLFAEKAESMFKSQVKRHSRGVKQAGFLVLRKTTMPSVLIELAYLSNTNDRSFMTTDAGVEKYAQAIAQAFSLYKKNLEGKTGKIEKENKTMVNSQSADTLAERTDKVLNKQPSSLPDSLTQSDKIMDIRSLQGVWFGLQILASSKPLTVDDQRIKLLDQVFVLTEGGLYKYFTSVSQHYNTSVKTLEKIRTIHVGAFPVAFEDGQKIDLKIARQKIK